MSISGVNGIGATAYAYMNSSMKTTGEGNFAKGRGKTEHNINYLCMGGGYGYFAATKL